MNGALIPVLLEDPDLATGLSPGERDRAERLLLARTARLESGPWRATEGDGAKTIVLVLEGLLMSDVVLAGVASADLIGPGDVLPDPALGSGETLLPVDVDLTVLEPSRLAFLDQRFQLSCARFPAVAVGVLDRVEQRAWRLAKQAAICNLPAVQVRLLALFWHLADRWGRVTPTHVVLPLRLLHRTLGKMVGAERSTVSVALKQLSAAELVTRRPDGAWLLKGEPSEHLEWMSEGSAGLPASRVPELAGEPAAKGRGRLTAGLLPAGVDSSGGRFL